MKEKFKFPFSIIKIIKKNWYIYKFFIKNLFHGEFTIFHFVVVSILVVEVDILVCSLVEDVDNNLVAVVGNKVGILVEVGILVVGILVVAVVEEVSILVVVGIRIVGILTLLNVKMKWCFVLLLILDYIPIDWNSAFHLFWNLWCYLFEVVLNFCLWIQLILKINLMFIWFKVGMTVELNAIYDCLHVFFIFDEYYFSEVYG